MSSPEEDGKEENNEIIPTTFFNDNPLYNDDDFSVPIFTLTTYS